jgi:hypothetical protein
LLRRIRDKEELVLLKNLISSSEKPYIVKENKRQGRISSSEKPYQFYL